MSDQLHLHTGTTVSSGAEQRLPSDSALLTAFLSPAGGSATCLVWGKAVPGAPWVLLRTFTLSGVSDQATYLLDNERWYSLKGEIQAISGGAEATIGAGV